MALEIKTIGGYFYLDSWVMANIIQLATQDFCRRFLNHSNDPCGRQYDQMTQAARSVVANIAEGISRHQTSRETEMKLTDVARASLAELHHDYYNWLLSHNQVPWAKDSKENAYVSAIKLDKPEYGEDLVHDSACHILKQKEKFTLCLANDDSYIVANSMLILISRLTAMVMKLLGKQLEAFKKNGGFRENLTKDRIEERNAPQTEPPICPKCGKPMVERTAKSGKNAGNKFWSCSAYPECTGTKPYK